MGFAEQERTAGTRTQQQLEYACALCGDTRLSPKRCSLCREVFYCSPGCQKSHWSSEHNRTCPRIFAPPPTASKKQVQNPCVNCGKLGTRQASGAWYCSNECFGGQMDTLAKSIKRLADPESTDSRNNDASVSSFITTMLDKSRGTDVQTQPSNPNDRVRHLIQETASKSNHSVAGARDDLDDQARVRDLIQQSEKISSVQPNVATDCGTDRLRRLIEQAENKKMSKPEVGADSDDVTDRVRSIIRDVEQQKEDKPHVGTTPTDAEGEVCDMIRRVEASNSTNVSTDTLREKVLPTVTEMNIITGKIREAEEALKKRQSDSQTEGHDYQMIKQLERMTNRIESASMTKQTPHSVSCAIGNADEIISLIKKAEATFSSRQSNAISNATLDDLD